MKNLIIILLAKATDDDYLQKGILAVNVDGKMTGQLFFNLFLALGKTGLKQILIDPLKIQYNFWGPLSAGGSFYFWKAQGLPSIVKVGGKISVADDIGSTDLVVRKVNNGGSIEVRLKRIFVF